MFFGKVRCDVVLHLLIRTNEKDALKPDPYPRRNWNFGIFLWITAFFPLKSTTYKIPIVHCNIGTSVKIF